ncbi:MAG: hypothetical protein SOT57_04715, partial [Eubacteriales bacterium]|nr:hypothetical protein [Eubacteriales bacterium]
VPSRWLRPLAPLKRLFPVNLPSANGLLKPVAASKSEFCAENNPPYDCSHTEDSLFYEPRPIARALFFVAHKRPLFETIGSKTAFSSLCGTGKDVILSPYGARIPIKQEETQ